MGKDSKEKVPLKQKAGAFFKSVKSLWKSPIEGRYLNLKEIGAFGIFATGNSFMFNGVNYVTTIALIPYFYRIDAIHAYLIIALATFINMVCLPFIGSRIERTKTKIGRYKPFIIGAIPLYVVFMILAMWIPQYDSEVSRIIYAYCTCMPVLVMATFVNNMYQNMPTVITPNTQERADIMVPIGLLVGFAPTIMNIIIGPIRAAFKEQEYMAMRIIGAVCAVLGVICLLFILKVKERVFNTESLQKKEEKIRFSDACRMLAKNKPLIILCVALILGSLREYTGQFRILVIQFRFHEDPSVALEISGLPQTIIGFAATVSMLLLPIVTRKMNKRAIVILFMIISTLPNLILSIVGYQNIPVGTASLVVLTILYFISCINPFYLLLPVMMGEIADYQQYKTGKRLDGYIQNLLFVVPGLTMNIFAIISYYWQKQVGFETKDYTDITRPLTGAEQAIACDWFNIVAILSAISGALMILVMIFYPLSKKKHQELLNALKERAGQLDGDGSSNMFIGDENSDNANVSLADETTVENFDEIIEDTSDSVNDDSTNIESDNDSVGDRRNERSD